METDRFDAFSKMQGFFQRCLEEMKKFHHQPYDYFFSILPMEAFSKLTPFGCLPLLSPKGKNCLALFKGPVCLLRLKVQKRAEDNK